MIFNVQDIETWFYLLRKKKRRGEEGEPISVVLYDDFSAARSDIGCSWCGKVTCLPSGSRILLIPSRQDSFFRPEKRRRLRRFGKFMQKKISGFRFFIDAKKIFTSFSQRKTKFCHINFFEMKPNSSGTITCFPALSGQLIVSLWRATLLLSYFIRVQAEIFD